MSDVGRRCIERKPPMRIVPKGPMPATADGMTAFTAAPRPDCT